MRSVPPLPCPVINRRRVLLGAAALVTTLTASACGVFGAGDPPDEPSDTPATDPLRLITTAARTDAALAAAVATTATTDNPTLAAPLGIVAAERTAHAVALEAEIARAAGATTTPSPLPSSPVTSSPASPVTVDALRAALTASAAAAGTLARTAPPYRAGLLGSVAAACSAQLAVLL